MSRLLLIACLALPLTAHAAEVPYTYADGTVRVVVEAENLDRAKQSGHIELNGTSYPFTAIIDPDTRWSQGTFTADGHAFVFNLTPSADGSTVKFHTGETVLTLKRAAASDASTPTGKATAGSVVMKKHTLIDPALNDMPSHTLLVPEGWTLNGKPLWNYGSLDFFVTLGLSVLAPDGREYCQFPHTGFTYTHGQLAPGTPPLPQPGTMTADGKIFLPPPDSAADFIVQTVLPQVRPQATNIQVLKTGTVTEIEKAIAPMFDTLVRDSRQLDQQMKQTSQMTGDESGTSFAYAVPTVRVRYTDAGRAYDEQFAMIFCRSDTYFTFRNIGSWVQTCEWSMSELASMRAPAGQFDKAEPLLTTIANSLKPTETWFAVITKFREDVKKMRAQQQAQQAQDQRDQNAAFQGNHAANQKAFQERQKNYTETQDYIRESNAAAWKSKNESDNRIQRATTNAILGVDDFTMPDGSIQSLDNNYERVFKNTRDDTLLFTNDLFFQPELDINNRWEEAKRIDPMGDGANR